ncbi:MAG: hypothetical protein EP330_07270 [Deltaproteobacteria bacterium]|nr:MAG: hypothetical protein EP330_07270 [Deltaproteobacteria bacterium]
MVRRLLVAGAVLAALPALAKPAPKAMLNQLAAYFQGTDVHLQPPVGEPSPKAGSFITRYQTPEGSEPDPKKYGTHEVSVGECTGHLVFKEVTAAEHRESLLKVESGVAAKIGIPGTGFSIGGEAGRSTLAGIEWDLTHKMILDSGEAEMIKCCLEEGQCTDEFISEWWKGTGTLYQARTDKVGVKALLKSLGKANGQIGLSSNSNFSQATSWDEPMYFAYRTTKLELPTCEDYLEKHPPGDDWVSFTGVSKFLDNEQQAEDDAWDHVVDQLVESLGARYDEGSDSAKVIAGDILGIFEQFSCRDTVKDARPQVQVRTRIKTEKTRFDAKVDELAGKEE